MSRTVKISQPSSPTYTDPVDKEAALIAAEQVKARKREENDRIWKAIMKAESSASSPIIPDPALAQYLNQAPPLAPQSGAEWVTVTSNETNLPIFTPRVTTPAPPLIPTESPRLNSNGDAAHPLGYVSFLHNTSIPISEIARPRTQLSDADLIQKYGPSVLQELMHFIENWRDSNEIDPVTTDEIESHDDNPCECALCQHHQEDSL